MFRSNFHADLWVWSLIFPKIKFIFDWSPAFLHLPYNRCGFPVWYFILFLSVLSLLSIDFSSFNHHHVITSLVQQLINEFICLFQIYTFYFFRIVLLFLNLPIHLSCWILVCSVSQPHISVVAFGLRHENPSSHRSLLESPWWGAASVFEKRSNATYFGITESIALSQKTWY